MAQRGAWLPAGLGAWDLSLFFVTIGGVTKCASGRLDSIAVQPEAPRDPFQRSVKTGAPSAHFN